MDKYEQIIDTRFMAIVISLVFLLGILLGAMISIRFLSCPPAPLCFGNTSSIRHIIDAVNTSGMVPA